MPTTNGKPTDYENPTASDKATINKQASEQSKRNLAGIAAGNQKQWDYDRRIGAKYTSKGGQKKVRKASSKQ